jgi:hypothetical protein
MRHEDFPILKPADQVKADTLKALDELSEISSAIDFAALAVIGMAKELGGEEGELIANHLRNQAERIQKASEHLSTIDLEATNRTRASRSSFYPQRRDQRHEVR